MSQDICKTGCLRESLCPEPDWSSWHVTAKPSGICGGLGRGEHSQRVAKGQAQTADLGVGRQHQLKAGDLDHLVVTRWVGRRRLQVAQPPTSGEPQDVPEWRTRRGLRAERLTQILLRRERRARHRSQTNPLTVTLGRRAVGCVPVRRSRRRPGRRHRVRRRPAPPRMARSARRTTGLPGGRSRCAETQLTGFRAPPGETPRTSR